MDRRGQHATSDYLIVKTKNNNLQIIKKKNKHLQSQYFLRPCLPLFLIGCCYGIYTCAHIFIPMPSAFQTKCKVP